MPSVPNPEAARLRTVTDDFDGWRRGALSLQKVLRHAPGGLLGRRRRLAVSPLWIVVLQGLPMGRGRHRRDLRTGFSCSAARRPSELNLRTSRNGGSASRSRLARCTTQTSLWMPQATSPCGVTRRDFATTRSGGTNRSSINTSVTTRPPTDLDIASQPIRKVA